MAADSETECAASYVSKDLALTDVFLLILGVRLVTSFLLASFITWRRRCKATKTYAETVYCV